MKLFAIFGTLLAAQVNVATPTAPTPVPPPVPQATPAQMAAMVSELRQKRLQLPIAGANPESLKGSFYSGRSEGRQHRAADFMAPRGTPVAAVDDGTIARLFTSKLGGLTIYQTDPSGRYVYYYAHLDSYANGLAQGDHISKGQIIGTAGQTGNATAPQLHLAIWQTTPDKIWSGIAIDPYEVFSNSKPESAPRPVAAPQQTQSPKTKKLWAIPQTKGTWI